MKYLKQSNDFKLNNTDEKEADVGKKDKKISAVKFPLNQVKLHMYISLILLLLLLLLIQLLSLILLSFLLLLLLSLLL